jgi:dTDP-4-dehydrorhamnose 3,5-epimerase
MIFEKTVVNDALVIELDKKEDERGFFARTFCENELREAGVSFRPVQANLSYNKNRYTLRGMHYQEAPYEEAKIIRCNRGAIYDVILDLRKDSSTLHNWFGIELNDKNRRSLYVPKGFAHGFLTLEDDTEVNYMMSEYYKPGAGMGIRWDDPFFNIDWPNKPDIISQKDRQWPYSEE